MYRPQCTQRVYFIQLSNPSLIMDSEGILYERLMCTELALSTPFLASGRSWYSSSLDGVFIDDLFYIFVLFSEFVFVFSTF